MIGSQRIFTSSVALLLSLTSVACGRFGGGMNGGGGGGSGGPDAAGFDLTHFVNTGAKKDVLSKGQEATGVYKDLGNLKNSFTAASASGAGNGLLTALPRGFRSVIADISSAPSPVALPQAQPTGNSTAETCSTPSDPTTAEVNGSEVVVSIQTCTKIQNGTEQQCIRTTYLEGDHRVTEECKGGQVTTSTSSTSSSESSTSIGGIMSFGPVGDCDDAFASFSSQYAQGEQQLSAILKILNDPNAVSALGGVKADSTTPDAGSAIVLTLAPVAGGDMTVSGQISGGVNGDLLVVREKMAMKSPAMDNQLNVTEAVDVHSKKAETSFDMTMKSTGQTVGSQGGAPSATMPQSPMPTGDSKVDPSTPPPAAMGGFTGLGDMHFSGNIVVSAGAVKFVNATLNVSIANGDQPMNVASTTKVSLLDPNTLAYDGSVKIGDQTGKFGFTVVRAGGKCSLKDVVNTVPQSQPATKR